MKQKGVNATIIGRDHQYGYGFEGGKEEQNELGLNWIDYGARNYDPAVGRWFVVDNMAEKFYDWTPYKYGMDNPIFYTDPDGNCETCWNVFVAVTQFLSGTAKGHVNFYENSKKAITEGVPDLMFRAVSIQGDIATGDFSGAASTYGDTAGNMAKGFIGPVLQVGEGIEDLANGDFQGAGANFSEAADAFILAVATDGVSRSFGAVSRLGTFADNVSNPVPSRMARVVPDDINTNTLAHPSQADAFVTAADDIKGMTNSEIANKLTIPEGSFKVIEFDTPSSGVSTPVFRNNPGFVQGGLTAGGAREFAIPNSTLQQLQNVRIIFPQQ